MEDGKCSRKLKMLMSNRRKIAQNCWIFGARSAGVTKRREGERKRQREEESKRGRDGGSDESRHLLLPFTVLRFLRSIRSLRSSQTLRTICSIRVLNSIRSIRSIRVLNSIREIHVQKQNVGFVFRLVYSFANARCVGV